MLPGPWRRAGADNWRPGCVIWRVAPGRRGGGGTAQGAVGGVEVRVWAFFAAAAGWHAARQAATLATASTTPAAKKRASSASPWLLMSSLARCGRSLAHQHGQAVPHRGQTYTAAVYDRVITHRRGVHTRRQAGHASARSSARGRGVRGASWVRARSSGARRRPSPRTTRPSRGP